MGKLDSYFQRKAQVLEERRADYQSEPANATIKLTASSRLAGATGARPTHMGSHAIVSDSAPGLAGHALGPTAPEILLGALASCLVHTYVIEAVLRGIPFDHVEVTVEGELDMSGVVGLPHRSLTCIQNIAYNASLETSASEEDIERLHHAVELGCPVLNTLRFPVSVVRSTNTPQPM